MKAIFIRHGQSTGNAGIPCDDLALLELTQKGWDQSGEVAAQWNRKPNLIVTSPYLRAKQTARPTSQRFPDIPVEVWPIQEFTYLQPSRWNGTSSTERMPFIERYWAAADPDYCDGEGAESFNSLLSRVEAALRRLEGFPEEALVYLFSHGQFIQATRSVITRPGRTTAERMLDFWKPGVAAIGNAELLALEFSCESWRETQKNGDATLSR